MLWHVVFCRLPVSLDPVSSVPSYSVRIQRRCYLTALLSQAQYISVQRRYVGESDCVCRVKCKYCGSWKHPWFHGTKTKLCYGPKLNWCLCWQHPWICLLFFVCNIKQSLLWERPWPKPESRTTGMWWLAFSHVLYSNSVSVWIDLIYFVLTDKFATRRAKHHGKLTYTPAAERICAHLFWKTWEKGFQSYRMMHFQFWSCSISLIMMISFKWLSNIRTQTH